MKIALTSLFLDLELELKPLGMLTHNMIQRLSLFAGLHCVQYEHMVSHLDKDSITCFIEDTYSANYFLSKHGIR